jgi:uridine kinase
MPELDGVEAAARRVEGLIAGLTEPAGRPLVVLIDGPAGSGKTTIATEVAGRLGATLVHMDSLYRGWGGLDAGSRIAAEDVVGPIASGSTASFRVWDWADSVEGEEQAVGPTDLLIVEGVGSASASARSHAALVVWVEADAELRYQRAIERDGEVFATHWDAWAAQEAEHFGREGTRAAADTVIDTGAA